MHCGSTYSIRRCVPISANFTPRSAPLSPRPRKGNITPGVSKEYTSGSCDNFNRVERALVNPGCAEVRSAFGVAGHMSTCREHTTDDERQKKPNVRPGIPMVLREFKSVDLPTFGMPTTSTFSSGICGCSRAMSIRANGQSRLRRGADRHTDKQAAYCFEILWPVP